MNINEAFSVNRIMVTYSKLNFLASFISKHGQSSGIATSCNCKCRSGRGMEPTKGVKGKWPAAWFGHYCCSVLSHRHQMMDKLQTIHSKHFSYMKLCIILPYEFKTIASLYSSFQIRRQVKLCFVPCMLLVGPVILSFLLRECCS